LKIFKQGLDIFYQGLIQKTRSDKKQARFFAVNLQKGQNEKRINPL